MNADTLLPVLHAAFARRYGRGPEVTAHAPGRVEVLGNHTDYNEGQVLSAALDAGTFFAAASRPDGVVRLTAGDIEEAVSFSVADPRSGTRAPWSNYVRGIVAGLCELRPLPHGFDAMFLGNLPIGAGLSSSAALEVSAGLALARLYGLAVEPLALARIGQAAEHRFAGARCGLLDPLTSLFGKEGHLVLTDFRSLHVSHVPFGAGAVLLLCNTHTRHAHAEGGYNRRRAACERAVAHFARRLSHPVSALRDVSADEWRAHHAGLPAAIARRAAHPIGEHERVRRGAARLAAGDLEGFGRLMFESHESSRALFKNSCAELDAVVDAARQAPGVLGARLTGGGFGGSAVILARPAQAEAASRAIADAFERRFGRRCSVRAFRPAAGARLVYDLHPPPGGTASVRP